MTRRGRPIHSGIKRATLFVLLLSELGSCLNNYHLFAEPKTWYEARRHCRQRYADLATADNMEDMERLMAAAGSGYQGSVWIGLRDKYLSWWWSTPTPSPYSNNTSPFSNWANREPNMKRQDPRLCTVFKNGFWFDVNCTDMYASVCHTHSDVLGGFTIDRYAFVKPKKTWHEAQSYCRKYHTDLARVRGQFENDIIKAVVPVDENAYIGLYRYPWHVWSDGLRRSFTYWADGLPLAKSGNCVASVINATLQGNWVEKACSTKLHFMCHSNKIRVLHFKLSSAVDLKSDPVLRENVLKVIEARIKEKGFTRDYRVTLI